MPSLEAALQLEADLCGSTTSCVYLLSDTIHINFLFNGQQSISGPSADEALEKGKTDKTAICKRYEIAARFTVILFMK
jgi:hypothetical protein